MDASDLWSVIVSMIHPQNWYINFFGFAICNTFIMIIVALFKEKKNKVNIAFHFLFKVPVINMLALNISVWLSIWLFKSDRESSYTMVMPLITFQYIHYFLYACFTNCFWIFFIVYNMIIVSLYSLSNHVHVTIAIILQIILFDLIFYNLLRGVYKLFKQEK